MRSRDGFREGAGAVEDDARLIRLPVGEKKKGRLLVIPGILLKTPFVLSLCARFKREKGKKISAN